MKKWFSSIVVILICVTNCNGTVSKNRNIEPTNLEIKDGWYYVYGEKFFVNALGYEIGARPGQHPYEYREIELARMAHDLKLIKEAGFNAIRTWSELTEEEVKLIQYTGLKMIFGIWIKPHADFSDPEFVKEALHLVDSIVSFTSKYDCIITYLIMNEPMPQHIHDVGVKNTYDLWMKAKEIIHEKHPGIPVTISGNSAITEYLNMNMFDVYSYNAYDYAEGINYAMGFANGNRFLKEINKGDLPLILTEFGKSVSRMGFGEYGGNTLKQQEDALIEYFRNVLDAGATGMCPFYYADGWWKGGEPSIHNDTPEEWFGYWGYKDLEDTIGYPRPVWYAVKEYNKALITAPKNQQFYENKVPMEIFLQDDIDMVRVIYHDAIVYEKNGLNDKYFVDTLSFGNDTLTDRELVFEFYNKKGELQKYEILIILTGNEPIEWPTLDVETDLDDISKGKTLKAGFTFKNKTNFKIEDGLRYVFQHHIGWQPGENQLAKIDADKSSQTFDVVYNIRDESLLLGIYAGVDVSYGKFRKTIYTHKLLFRGDWADPIRIK
ncbi:MAG: hypothetical protein JW894_11455 [Bacteroidales bacterium]|nr:hypothetical protein [Bacteroidales bacterium]